MDLYANFAYATLTEGVLGSATVLTVDSTNRIPDPSQGEVWLTIDSTLALGQFEIVKVISKTAGTLTVLRAQEGTAAPTTTATGTVLRGTITAAMLERLRTSRQEVTYNSAVLAPQGTELGLVELGKSYRLMRISTTGPCRVRLYDRTDSQLADVDRPRGEDPETDSGVIFDFVTTNARLAANLSPLVDGMDWENTPDGLIPITVTSLESTVFRDFDITLTYLRTET